MSTVTAAVAVANIVKSSLGPVGLDKMLVDDVGVSGLAMSPAVSQIASHLMPIAPFWGSFQPARM